MTPTEEISSAKQAIKDKLAEADAAIEAAHREYDAWVDRDKAAEQNLARARRNLVALNARAAEANARLKVLEMPAVTLALDTGGADLSKLAALFDLEREHRLILRGIAGAVESIIPELELLHLFTEKELRFAEAVKIDTHCDRRDVQLQISLADAVRREGSIVVDQDRTVTGQLRKRAADLRLTAASIAQKILEIENTRKK